LDCDARRRLHWRFAVVRWSVTLMVPQMVHLQDVVKLHTFVLGDLGALLWACFGFDLRFALVAFDLVSDSIWCEGVGVGVGGRGGSTWAGGDYFRGALGWERRAILRTTNKARSHTHKLKPFNHFTVVPQPLSPLRFNSRAAARPCVPERGAARPVSSQRSMADHGRETVFPGWHVGASDRAPVRRFQ